MGYSVADFGCGCFNGVDGYRSRAETMIQPVILEKSAQLPESLQTEVLHCIEFLIKKQAKNSTQEKPTKRGGLEFGKVKSGCLMILRSSLRI